MPTGSTSSHANDRPRHSGHTPAAGQRRKAQSAQRWKTSRPSLASAQNRGAVHAHPDVLLLDEPLGALDLKLRRQMQ
ncbi:hypothetical protein ACLMMR_36760, partial [Streptomyces sp. NPDC000405]